MSERETLEEPLVSILIPCNRTDYIYQTLTSILVQSYSRYEIVIALNGSAIVEKENIEKFLTANGASHQVVVSKFENIVSARNEALINCKSNYVCNIDSDDIMPKNRIRNQIRHFQGNPKLVCLGGQLVKLVGSTEESFFPYPSTYELTKHSLFRYSSLPQPGVMFLKDAVIKVGAYRNKFLWLEDWDLWLRLSRVGEIFNMPETSVYYRVHSFQVTKVHSTEIVINTLNLLVSNLEMIIDGYSADDLDENTSKYRNSVIKKAFLCLILVKRPYLKEGLFGLKEVRRGMAGIYFQESFLSTHKLSFRVDVAKRLTIIFIDPRILYTKLLSKFRS